jgi:hypothetical protein
MVRAREPVRTREKVRGRKQVSPARTAHLSGYEQRRGSTVKEAAEHRQSGGEHRRQFEVLIRKRRKKTPGQRR